MVGIVLVSHSRSLAQSVQALVQAMTGKKLPLTIAAGVGEGRAETGTDAVEIAEAIQSVISEEGVLVLMDMGSAVLSAETALDLLDPSLRQRIRLSSAAFLEGAIAAGVTASLGAALDQVASEAEQALRPKLAHLHPESMSSEGKHGRAARATADETTTSRVLAVTNAHGLHARPIARLIREIARFQADVTVENVTAHKGPVSARSLSALAALEVRQDQEIRVSATGSDARQALEAIRMLVESGLGDSPARLPESAPAGTVPPGRAQGVCEGIAFGPMLVQRDHPLTVPQHPAAGSEQETARLHAALAAVRASLLQERERAERIVGADAADIFAAQAALLDDPALRQRAQELIARHKANAAWAWHEAVGEVAATFREFGDDYLRQRAGDIDDVGNRVLREFGVKTEPDLPLNQPGVLVVNDLTPAQVAQLQGSPLAGVICLDGGAASHGAILMRAMGLPCIAHARAILADLAGKRLATQLAFDGATGEIWIDPNEHQMADLTALREKWRADRAEQLLSARQPAAMADGHIATLLATVNQPGDAEAIVRCGAEGIGLLRTEFLFLHRAAAPTEEQQVAALAPIVRLAGARPVVVRTLDAGGDKDLPYLGLPPETNPFLGVRGLRICLRQPAMFQTQLRAVLRAGVNAQLHVMFPMVSDVTELREARRQLELAHASLASENIPHLWPVPTGIMMEVPSAALLADELAQHCDFFSIGTNDLTQYTLAADRGNAELRPFHDALHPAVLLLIRQIVDAAHRHGKRVALCGEAAADASAAVIFVGLGVDELSVTPWAIPRVKAALRAASFQRMQDLAGEAIRQSSAEAVRQLISPLA